MKMTIKIITGLTLITLLAGCVVTSVYPFYTTKDEVFDPALIGTWSESGAKESTNDFWQFARLNEQAYWLTTVENDKANHYETHRFYLKQHVFLDLCPTNRHEDQVPLHYLVKIAATESNLQYAVLNFEWLAKLLEKNPRALRHILVPNEPGNTNHQQLILTANTVELQRFLLKHVKDTNAFADWKELKRGAD